MTWFPATNGVVLHTRSIEHSLASFGAELWVVRLGGIR